MKLNLYRFQHLKPFIIPVISLIIIIIISLSILDSLGRGISIRKLLLPQKPGTLTLSIPEKVILNQPFNVDINLDTHGQKINAVGLYMHFDPSKLLVSDIDTTNSFCQFYPEKKYDNHLGTISLACGSPHPGFSGQNTVVKLKFIPRLIGTTALNFDSQSRILLNDGKGTNILLELPQHTITIRQGL